MGGKVEVDLPELLKVRWIVRILWEGTVAHHLG